MPSPSLFLIFVQSAAGETVTCGCRYTNNGAENITISECIFSSLNAYGNGGAICLNNGEIIASANFSSFDKCTAFQKTLAGGAIFCYVKLIGIFSVCFSKCYANRANIFYLQGSDSSLYHIYSISSSDCFSQASESVNLAVTFSINSQFEFINVSNSQPTESTDFFVFNADPTVYSLFATMSNLRSSVSLLQNQMGQNFSFDDANIIKCAGLSFCSVSDAKSDLFFRSCVFSSEDFSSLVSCVTKSSAIHFVFYDCWFSKNRTIESSANITFIECNTTSTDTLSFSDQYIFTNGLSCGIRLPSPSPSLLPNALRGYQIALIVIGFIAVLCLIAVLFWFLYQKAEYGRYRSDAQAVLLMRSLENSYG